jgi:hypothetical protein
MPVPVKVMLYYAPYLGVDGFVNKRYIQNEGLILGHFDTRTGKVLISVAAKPRLSMEWLAHELAHYEQWLENKPLVEHGRDLRARALLRQWRKERNGSTND